MVKYYHTLHNYTKTTNSGLNLNINLRNFIKRGQNNGGTGSREKEESTRKEKHAPFTYATKEIHMEILTDYNSVLLTIVVITHSFFAVRLCSHTFSSNASVTCRRRGRRHCAAT